MTSTDLGQSVGNQVLMPPVDRTTIERVAEDFLSTKIQARHLINWNQANMLFLHAQQLAKQYHMEPEIRNKITPFPSPPSNNTVNVLNMDPSAIAGLLSSFMQQSPVGSSGEGQSETEKGRVTPAAPIIPAAPSSTTSQPASSDPSPSASNGWLKPALFTVGGALLGVAPWLLSNGYSVYQQWNQSHVTNPPVVEAPDVVVPPTLTPDMGADIGVTIR